MTEVDPTFASMTDRLFAENGRIQYFLKPKDYSKHYEVRAVWNLPEGVANEHRFLSIPDLANNTISVGFPTITKETLTRLTPDSGFGIRVYLKNGAMDWMITGKPKDMFTPIIFSD